ncbi:SMC-Scp complex subunit ScpB [Rurimicrobium arvi]|uniref:SMC-Scp complex subunit ScpB n=2 Tax=Rurimicrobium arvi TaxID=2049916 RepID=A0ABP8MIR6_9BACT
MELEQLILHVEALIFASERPITPAEIADHVSQALEEEIDAVRVEAAVDAIREKYEAGFYPFHIREIGGGYQFLTKKDYHKTVLQLNGDKHIKKLSAAAMETLAIIAYKQPITKGDIEFIRGVSADYSIQKLLEKELIAIVGRNEEAVGKPLLYSVSRNFMDYLGINSPAQLPQLKDINIDMVLPSSAAEAQPADAVTAALTVDGEGNLNEHQA